MKLKSSEIYDIIKEIRFKCDNNQVIDENDYKEFREIYPNIFNMVISNNFNNDTLKQLNFLLDQLKQIENNKISEYNASVKVGTVFVDKYVKPNL
jgi:hypothetical protein